MVRQNKEVEARTFIINQGLCDKLGVYSEKTSLSKTAIVEKALAEYFEKHKNDKQQNIQRYLVLSCDILL